MLEQQIEECSTWAGAYNCYVLLFHELMGMYCKSIFDFPKAIEYGQYALEDVIEIYGENSAETVEKLYQLGNILTDYDQFEQALNAYSQSLALLAAESD